MQSQVKLNRVSEKVPEGRGGFGAEPGHVQQGSREGAGEGLAGGERRGGFGAEPGQVLGQVLQSTGFRRRSGEGLGGFGAEPGQVQQGSGEGSRRRRSARLWCRASAGSTEFRRRFQRRFWEALVQSQVRFNRVPGEEGLGGFGAEPAQAQQSSGEGSREGSGRLACRAMGQVPENVPGEGLGGFGAEPGQVHQVSGEGSGEASGRLWWVRFNKVLEKVPEKVWEALV